MLFPGVLNRIPPALLSMLELKQRGANPDTLSDTVVPVIDLSHWYGADTPTCYAGSLDLLSAEVYANPLLFNVSQIVVPQDELWWLRSFSVALDANVLTVTGFYVYQLAPIIILPNLASSTGGVPASRQCTIVGESCPSERDGLPAVTTVGMTIFSPSLRDMWVPPGSSFGAQFVGSVTDPANTPHLIGDVVVDRFKI